MRSTVSSGPPVKAGAFTPPPFGVGLVVLETTGHRSGLRREVPLLAARVGRRITVSTGRADSHWVTNLEADEEPAVWVGGCKRAATAEVTRGRVNVASLRVA